MTEGSTIEGEVHKLWNQEGLASDPSLLTDLQVHDLENVSRSLQAAASTSPF